MKVVAEERKTQKVKVFDPSTVVGFSHGLLDWGFCVFKRLLYLFIIVPGGGVHMEVRRQLA